MPLQLDEASHVSNLSHHEIESFVVVLEGMFEDLECHNVLFLGIMLLRFIDVAARSFLLPILIQQLLASAIILIIIIFHKIPKIFGNYLFSSHLCSILLVFSDLEYLGSEDLDNLIVPVLLFYNENLVELLVA